MFFTYDCPNTEANCKGEIEFSVSAERESYSGRFAGSETLYIAEVSEQTCQCDLKEFKYEMDKLEQEACEDMASERRYR